MQICVLGVSVKRKNRYREKAYTFAGAKVLLFFDIRKSLYIFIQKKSRRKDRHPPQSPSAYRS